MTVNIWSYLEEYNNEKNEILNAVSNVFSSGRLILGQQVETFEKNFAEYCESKYGIGVNSATDGLFLALKALDIGAGDEVLTVSNTAVPTVSAIISAGATPVFIDIDSSNYLMDINLLERKISKKTKCILPVHLYGQCVDMGKINVIAKKYNLYVIEDCSQSHGATYKNKKCGSLSDISVFSFYPTKILGAYGDGGIIITSNKKINEKLRRLRFYGMEKEYYAVEHGYNSRLDEVQAAILNYKLTNIEKYIEKRKQIAKLYYDNLKLKNLILPKIDKYNSSVFYLFVVRHKEREEIIKYLKHNNIFVNISYPYPIHLMKAYKKLKYKKGDLPNTEIIADEIFSLPIYPYLDYEKILYVCEILNNFK